jgi:hypothetical protein
MYTSEPVAGGFIKFVRTVCPGTPLGMPELGLEKRYSNLALARSIAGEAALEIKFS